MTGTERIFLGVERSVSGRRWIHALDARAENLSLATAQKHGIPDIVARVLAARGIGANETLAFLEPSLKRLMPDPSCFTDMDRAASRLADAIGRREPVAIFGDYDVDGAASSALLARYLRHFGLTPQIRIPDRITEGYGPNVAAMRALVEEGARLVVTVDCGTTSFEPVAAARAAGADVVVVDHHQTGTELPPAFALVNPNRQDDLSGQGHLAAAGVVFMLLVAVSRELRRRGMAPADLPNLLDLLDLVALATVCDVVPLIGLNRAFVTKGLRTMRARSNPGLRSLAHVARINGPIDVFHLGFILGPRINAGGRIDAADLGSRLLITTDEGESLEIAERLHGLNEERQAMERQMLAEAEAEIAAEFGDGTQAGILVAGSANWHPGIVGLIAARLKERYGRPAFAIAFDANGRGTGSGRSVDGIDLGALVRRAVKEGILEKGGGHAMAAGITVMRSRLGDLRAFMEEAAGDLTRRLAAAQVMKLDGAVSAGGLTPDLVRTLEKAGPYGAGHARPLLALPRHRLVSASVVGRGHVRATLRAADGAVLSAIAFRAEGSEVGRRLLSREGGAVHAAGTAGIDRYRGTESVQFRLVDIAEAYD